MIGWIRRLPLALAVIAACLAVAPAAGAYSITTVPGFTLPAGVAVTPDGDRILVADFLNPPGQFTSPLAVIDAATLAVDFDVLVGEGDRGMSVAVSPDGSRIYLGTSLNTGGLISVVTIDAVTLTPIGDPVGVVADTGGNELDAMAVSPDGRYVYVVSRNADTFSTIDTETTPNTVTPIAIGDEPTDVAVSPDGSEVYVTLFGTNEVKVVDTASNTVTATITGTGQLAMNQPRAVAFSPDGAFAYVANFNTDKNFVSVIDTATGVVVDQIEVVGPGSSPTMPNLTGIAVSPDGSQVYVVGQTASNNVAVLDVDPDDGSGTTASIVSSGSRISTRTVAVAPDGSRFYVTNRQDGTVSVIQFVPTAPTALTATKTATSATISFTAGADSGAAITGYEYSLDDGAWTAASTTTSPVVISGLQPDTAHSVRLRAVNARGSGDPSTALSFRTDQAPPNAPVGVSARPWLDGSVDVVFTPGPAGGPPVDDYAATCTSANGGAEVRGTGTASPIVLRDLSAGKRYTCTVAARNNAGSTPAASASDAFTVPTGTVTWTVRDLVLEATFTAPFGAAYALRATKGSSTRTAICTAVGERVSCRTRITAGRWQAAIVSATASARTYRQRTVDAARVPRPVGVRWSTATTTQVLQARFTAPASKAKRTYTAEARLGGTKPRTVRGTCQARRGTVTCRWRLPQAGSWRVTLTAREGVSSSAPTTTTIRVTRG